MKQSKNRRSQINRYSRKHMGTAAVSCFEPLEARTLMAANLIVNGDFETPQIGLGASGLGYTNYAAPSVLGAGWKVTVANVDIVSNAKGAQYASTPAHGNQYIDMNGDSAGTIAQTVSTVAGTEYTLELAYTATPFGSGTRTMTVSAGGKLLATLSKDETGETPTAPGWKFVSYTITASSSSTTVTFADTSSGGYGMALDDVSLTALPAGSITGTVFSDTNANGKLDSGEKGLSGETVYIDTKKTGVFATGDPTAVTTSTGAYTFTDLAAGTYVVREKIPTGYKLTAPTAGDFSVTVVAGKIANGFAFADAPATASVSGTIFNDANGNGKKDVGEEGLGLWTVYIDLKKDGKDDAGDPSVTTNILGAWSFSGLVAGTYTVRVVPVTGSVATTPTGGVKTITLTAGQSSVGNLFGEKTTS